MNKNVMMSSSFQLIKLQKILSRNNKFHFGGSLGTFLFYVVTGRPPLLILSLNPTLWGLVFDIMVLFTSRRPVLLVLMQLG